MRVKDLQQVTTIDKEITALQQQLIELYQTREQLMQTPLTQDNQKTTALYQSLSQAWSRVEVVIPEENILHPLLEKATTLQQEWEALQPDLEGRLKVLLVPPVESMGIPVYAELRQKQRLLQGTDIIDQKISLPSGSKKWRVLVVFAHPEGLQIEDASRYDYNQKPVRALGMQEYCALTLQLSQPIDTKTWTSFPARKTSTADTQMIYAGCRHGRYRFGINDIHGALEDDRFRPAIEVR